ncbi:MAG: NirD/YgiW/YdeI family stress tolerance protein [Spirochaetales bacterium]|nr:NirD/YgiW/YdeI family stress tolerance protein [Spirochaetales bacterium]
MKYVLMATIALAFIVGEVSAQSSDEVPVVQAIRSLRRGDFATIQGEVVRYRDRDEILVRDASGRIEVFLGSEDFSQPLVTVGETVIVTGWVDDDVIDIPRELYATRIVRANGAVIELAGRSDYGW